MSSTSVRLLLRADPAGVRWSVVAGNGRVLGVAVGPLADARAACSHFQLLCPQLPDLPVAFGREHRAREWTWQVGDVESGYLARSGQSYARHATARAAFARFVDAAALLCDAIDPSVPVRGRDGRVVPDPPTSDTVSLNGVL